VKGTKIILKKSKLRKIQYSIQILLGKKTLIENNGHLVIAITEVIPCKKTLIENNLISLVDLFGLNTK
jgi:hypothetical protein